jgi:hypothetical protein
LPNTQSPNTQLPNTQLPNTQSTGGPRLWPEQLQEVM